MFKYTYTLKGLNCAGCAATIEQELKSLDGITGVNIDFIDKELTFYVRDGKFSTTLKATVSKLIKKIEPDVELVLSQEKQNNVRFRDSLISSIKSVETITAIFGIIIILAGIFTRFDSLKPLLFLSGYLLVGWQIILKAGRSLFTRYLFNENLLMSVATIGAIFIGEYLEAIAVMLFYQIGKFLESKMIDYSQKSINELLSISPEYANLVSGNDIIRTEPDKIKKGDIIIVKPGERIPLDCTLIEGSSEIDNSIITGESMPVAVAVGGKILSGAINLHSSFKAKVDTDFAHSTISRIIEIIKTAKSKKTKTERFISRFAKVYTPIILSLAFLMALLPPLIFKDALFSVWFYRALIFLVISCPCALVISVPLSFFSGLAVLVKSGVLIKGAVHIENLAMTAKVFLDKTGTITTGRMKVANIIPAHGYDEYDIVRYAYYAESHSNHPLAIAVNLKFHELEHSHNANPDRSEPNRENSLLSNKLNTKDFSVKEIPGKGLIAQSDNGTVTVGSLSFLAERGIDAAYKNNNNAAVIAVALGNKFLGIIEFSDTVRKSIKDMIDKLKQSNISVTMLTGDKEEVAASIAEEAGVSSYLSELKPEDKMNIVNNYKLKHPAKNKTIFIGDGINDAPAMSSADVGIAMGGIGAAVSIEAADVVLQTDEIDKLARIIYISKKTLNKAKQNIVFALGIKAVFLGLGALGLITIWGAVFADVGVTIIAVLNSLQLLKYRKSS